MNRSLPFAAGFCLAFAAGSPAWGQSVQATAAKPAVSADAPLTAAETREFMRRLAGYVVDNHLKRDDSPQRGMTYEYFRPASRGEFDQYVQGEALDTMHDGAWLAAALATAFRATGDPHYKEILVHWQLPFYLKMLNHGDELFNADVNHARAERRDTWKTSKEWLLRGREKGFVPYFWDDGSSVSLEMRNDRRAELAFPGFNQFVADGKPNPEYRLAGYSLGSSNHLAQDLAVMLEVAWLLLRESPDQAERAPADETARGAKHLYECRLRHHGHIPAVDAAWGLISGDEKILQGATDGASPQWWTPKNHYTAALRDFKPGQKITTPGFADDQEYLYYATIARAGGKLPEPMAFKLTYDAYTQPQLYRMYCDDEPPPPGINRFDLHPYTFVDGKPADYRSQRKGPGGKPRPIGSRMGPQNMVVCGWALQALKQSPGLWEKPYREKYSGDKLVAPAEAAKVAAPTTPIEHGRYPATDPPGGYVYALTPEAEVRASLERELGVGLRTWRDIFDRYGYIPTGIGAGGMGAGFAWEEYSDTGGYAHLIAAGSQWLFYLDGRRDWEEQKVPAVSKR